MIPMQTNRTIISWIAIICLVLPLTAADTADLAVVHSIKAEAFDNSEVMDHVFYLTDVNGPRVTNSPGHRAAAEWIINRLEKYGLENVKLEEWGPFGRGWSFSRFLNTTPRRRE